MSLNSLNNQQQQKFKNMPPDLDLSQLTSQELEQLSKVMKKHEELENKFERVISPGLLLSPSPTHSIQENNSLKSASQDSMSSNANMNVNNNNNNSPKFSIPFKTSNNSISSKKSSNESLSLINRIASFKSLRNFLDTSKNSPNNSDKQSTISNQTIDEDNNTNINLKISHSSPSSPLKRKSSGQKYCSLCRSSILNNQITNDSIKCNDCYNLICYKCYCVNNNEEYNINTFWICKICMLKNNNQSSSNQDRQSKKSTDNKILGSFGIGKIINEISNKISYSFIVNDNSKNDINSKKNDNDNNNNTGSSYIPKSALKEYKENDLTNNNTTSKNKILRSDSVSLHAFRNTPIALSIQERRLSRSNDLDSNNKTNNQPRKDSLSLQLNEKENNNSSVKVVSISDVNKYIERKSLRQKKTELFKQMSSIESKKDESNTNTNTNGDRKEKARRFSFSVIHKRPKRPSLRPQKSIDSSKKNFLICDTINEEKCSLNSIKMKTNESSEQSTSQANYQSKKKKHFKRSFSNDARSNKSSDNRKLYLQRQSVDKITDKQILENLADLAQVILIEHKKTIAKKIKMEDSFTTDSMTNSNNQSRQDTFSSHKESNSSVNNEGELVRRAAKEISMRTTISPGDIINKTKSKKEFLSSEKLHKRRMDLMRKSKKWSHALDQTDNGCCNAGDLVNSSLTNSSINSNLEQQGVYSNSTSTNNDDSMCTSLPTAYDDVISNDGSSYQFSLNKNSSVNSSKHKLDEQNNNSNSSSNASSFKSFVHTSIDHNQIQQISILSSNLDHRSTIKRLSSRKLPELPSKISESNNTNSKSAISKLDNKTTSNIDKKMLENREESDKLILDVNFTPVVKQKLNKTKSKSLDSSKTASENQSLNSPNSDNSIKHKNKDSRLNFSSVDVNIASFFEKRNLNIFDSIPSSQRSIDYPSIVRKNHPNLSDIVRKRLLFEKINHKMALFGEQFSNSIEKDHVPKQQRTIVIRKDNSIELKLRRPPKMRNQTASVDLLNISTFSTLVATETVKSIEPAKNTTNELQVASVAKNTSMLSVSSANSDTSRRKTIETCENIFNISEETTKLRAKSSPNNPHRILLYKDKSDRYIRTNGLGMIIIGGHECEDGSLGCFVSTVIKGGPADMNNIEVGDQILEFNGHSLIDSTYEEVRTLQNYSVDYVQLVVQHNMISYNNNQNNNSLQISRNFQTLPRLCQSVTNRRRNLPPLPSLPQNQQNQKSNNPNKFKKEFSVAETLFVPSKNSMLKPILINRGRLLMQLWDDSVKSKLAITINHANNLPPRSESEKWYTFIVGRLFCDDETIHKFKSSPILADTQSWNETFVFEYNDLLEEVILEIIVYDTLWPEDTRSLRENFIGMISLPLNEANLEDEPRWYELRDKQNRKNSNASVTFKSSSNDESMDSLCEKKRKILNIISGKHMSRKSTVASKSSSLHPSPKSREDVSSQSRQHSKKGSVRKLSRAIARLFSRRSSDTCVNKQKKIEIQSQLIDQNETADSSINRNSKRNRQRRHTELLGVDFLLPNSNSSENSRRTSNTSNEDMDRYFFALQNTKLNDPRVNGLGQITPKTDLKENIVTGCIKLGFIMSKGQLEIFVYEARNLKNGPYKEIYVKTYLRSGTQKLNKKKTHIIRNSSEPVFNSKFCYKACNVLGRKIQIVMICEKGKQETSCIGEAFIQLDLLDLSQQSISWYKLYKENLLENDLFDSN